MSLARISEDARSLAAESALCPALFISAPASNHGKTTVTAALARFHARQGRKVRVFKAGPDFLDPMILERACGAPVYQLDLWLAGADACRRLVHQAALEADLILIEGVMGLFDGTPSCADLAQLLGVPVLAVIDATGVAQTLAAIAFGLANFRPGLPFAGVLANNVASARHGEMIEQGMPAQLPYFGALPRAPHFALPARHMGLVQAEEIDDLDARLSSAAASLARTGLAALPAAVRFDAVDMDAVPMPQLLAGVRIGIARDKAFSFIYPANLDLLRALGARLLFFSPLDDGALPQVDSLYLPGGYPELHLAQLESNGAMKAALQRHAQAGKPIYAECGGMLYLLESLTDQAGRRGAMAALLPGHGVLQAGLKGLGYQSAAMPGGVLRSHTFHHSMVATTMRPHSVGARLYKSSAGEAIYQEGCVIATYLHCYFPSNPDAAAGLFLR